MVEVWKTVPDFRDYEVSNLGRVRSWKQTTPRVLKNRKQATGYDLVSLCQQGREFPFLVHRLVLEAFVGKCPEGMETRHRNGIRQDNRLTNLHWGTRPENAKDRIAHGTQTRGETQGGAKLTDDAVREARRLYVPGDREYGATALARRYGVSVDAMWQAVTRRRWRHVA